MCRSMYIAAPVHLTSMDGGNAKGLYGTILAMHPGHTTDKDGGSAEIAGAISLPTAGSPKDGIILEGATLGGAAPAHPAPAAYRSS